MRNLTVLITSILVMMACKETKKEQLSDRETELETGESEVKEFKRTQNYAVIFNWTTQDVQSVMEISVPQSHQLRKLWEDNIVENVYYDAEAKYDKLAHFPNITFTMKAEDMESVKAVLDNLVMVKNKLAKYTVYPIGTLWLKRNAEAIEKRRGTASYVAVWTTDYKPERTMVMGQNDKVMELWNKGKIENVYFDIEGSQKENDKTDFVFFVNSNTEEGAKEIINALPFVRNAVASYKLYPVDIFWMGVKED